MSWIINYMVAPCREEVLRAGQEQVLSAERVRETFQGEGFLSWNLTDS